MQHWPPVDLWKTTIDPCNHSNSYRCFVPQCHLFLYLNLGSQSTAWFFFVLRPVEAGNIKFILSWSLGSQNKNCICYTKYEIYLWNSELIVGWERPCLGYWYTVSCDRQWAHLWDMTVNEIVVYDILYCSSSECGHSGQWQWKKLDDEDLTWSDTKTQTSCYYSELFNILLSFFRLVLLFRFPPFCLAIFPWLWVE